MAGVYGRRGVEVRVSRRGRSLRVDGTFASWYEPGRAVTRSVWDALAAPLLWLPPERRRRVLILGLGGGSAARVVRALAPRARIVGVEKSVEVLYAARRWLDLDGLGVRVVEGDAQSYLQRSRARFDVVIEDVFVGRGRSLHKPDWLPRPGLRLARSKLSRGGLLVSNAIDEAPAVARELLRIFPSALRIDVAGYDNRVLVGGPARLRGRALRSAVGADDQLSGTLARLRFRTLVRPPAGGGAATGANGRRSGTGSRRD
jgi:spermidine synthase